MDIDPSGSGGWRFAQCFGDKGEVEDITEGESLSLSALIAHPPPPISRHHIHRRVRLYRQLPCNGRQGWPCRPLRAERVGE